MMNMLETERLCLKKTAIEEAEQIEVLASDYDVAKTTLTIPHPYPKGGAVDFIKDMQESEKEGKVINYTIVSKKTDELIGIINLNIKDPNHKRGELGYWIGKPYWGMGYGTEATRAVIHYGFTQLNLNKIFAQAFEANPGSWRIMEKAGMTYEGTLKQHFFRFGEYINIVNYGLLYEDFIKKQKRRKKSF